MPKNKKQDPDFKPGATNNTYRSTYNKDTKHSSAASRYIFIEVWAKNPYGQCDKTCTTCVVPFSIHSCFDEIWDVQRFLCKKQFNIFDLLTKTFFGQLAPLGGILGPLKSDLGLFWPFRAIYSRYMIFTKSSFKVWFMDGSFFSVFSKFTYKWTPQTNLAHLAHSFGGRKNHFFQIIAVF